MSIDENMLNFLTIRTRISFADDFGERRSVPVIKKEDLPINDASKRSSISTPTMSIKPKLIWLPLEAFPAVDNSQVPRVTIWKPFTKEHINCLQYLNEKEALNFIDDKILPENFSETNKHFTKILLYDTLRWCQKNCFNDKKTSSMLGMVYNTHRYFIGSIRRNQNDTYTFFKKSLLLHTIQDPPKSAEIFKPEECRSGIFYFLNTYLPVLPLLRVQLQPNYRLKLQWEQKTLNPSA